MAEKELSSEETDAYRKELEELKAERMRHELEEIKRERMRDELAAIKAERTPSVTAQPKQPVYAGASKPALSLPNLAAAVLLLLLAGYLAGSAFGTDAAGSIDSAIRGLYLPFTLPFGGSAIVAVVAIVFALLGIALTTITRK